MKDAKGRDAFLAGILAAAAIVLLCILFASTL